MNRVFSPSIFSAVVLLSACSAGPGGVASGGQSLNGSWVVTNPTTYKTQLNISISRAGFSVSTPDGERTGIALNSNGATYESRSPNGELVTGVSARVGGATSSYGAIPFSLSGA